MGLGPGDYDLRSNMAGTAISGDIVLHADEIYIQITTSSFGHGREVMFRRCKGRQDYRGEHNNFCDIAVLADPVRFTALVARETGLAPVRRQLELV